MRGFRTIGDGAGRPPEDLPTPLPGGGYGSREARARQAADALRGGAKRASADRDGIRAVASEDRPGDQADAPQGGVFGNLPDSRPGTRSPRRDAATRKRAARSTPDANTAGAPTKPKPKPSRPAPRRPAPQAKARAPSKPHEPGPEQRAPESDAPAGGGLEDLAWAGVAAAAEAATIGVRLASRAMEALRKPVDRR
jgi:hypothetical protein